MPAPGAPLIKRLWPAGRRDFERALGALLALDVAQVRLRSGRSAQRGFRPGQHLRALEVVGELDQRARREDLEIADAQAASGPHGAGQIRPLPAALAAIAAGSTPATALIVAVERELPDDREAVERVGRNGADRRHHRERDRQVVVAALLRHVGRREVDRDALGRKGEARGDQRRAHPLARFAHRLVAEADDGEGDRA